MRPRVLAALALLAAAPQRPVDWSRETVATAPLAPRLWLVTGRGGNVGVVAGSRALLVIDGQFDALAPQTLAAIAAVDPRRPTHNVLTHWHRDHVGLAASMREAGADVIATPATRARLSSPQLTRAFEHVVPPLPPGAQPNRLVARPATLDLGGERARLIPLGPAHTDGDLLVRLQRADVLFTGDVVVRGLPFIERASGGTIDGLIAGTAQVLSLAGPRTAIVPGHGAPMTRAELAAHHAKLLTIRARVATQAAAGRSLEQVVASGPAREWDDPAALPFARADAFVADVYRTLPQNRR